MSKFLNYLGFHFSKKNLMAKISTFPTLYDEVKTISISFLREQGYLKPNQWQSGAITWSRGNVKTGAVSILVNMLSENPYLELDYKCDGVPIKYRVDLISIPSNLGKGVVWYFMCPRTEMLCRKLYFVDKYFYHRSAFEGCMYEKQTHSKKMRALYKEFGVLFEQDTIYKQIYGKHFKRSYNGKLTKRYLRFIKLFDKS